MSYPLVSVLIPAYNCAPWIRYAILSACNQTWPNKEIIVVDDGSTDDTLKIAQKFKPFGVTVISQPNRGAAAARNTAFMASYGDYIQWLDADDLLDREKIAKQIWTAHWLQLGPQVLLSGSWAYFHYCTARAQFQHSVLWGHLSPVEWMLKKMGHNLHMPPMTWLMSRQLAEAAGPWDESLTNDDDGEYFARVICASQGIRHVYESHSYYRKVGFNSLSSIAGNGPKLQSLAKSMQLHVDYLLALEDSPRTREACATYVRNWLHEFYPYRQDLATELQEMAGELDQPVEPRLPAKYQWIANTLGWAAARKAQILLPRIRWSAAMGWDRLLWQIGVH